MELFSEQKKNSVQLATLDSNNWSMAYIYIPLLVREKDDIKGNRIVKDYTEKGLTTVKPR